KDRDEQGGQELPLWLTEPGHLSQDVVDNCHKPFTGSSGSGIRSPHLTSLWPRLFTSFTQKMSKVLILKVPKIVSCMPSMKAQGHGESDLTAMVVSCGN